LLKLSKTSWIFLAAGIFLIVGFSLVMARSQQTEQQNTLQEDLRKANLNLSQIKLDDLTAQKDDLTLKIDEYDTMTAETKAILTSSKDSIDTTNAILEEAQTRGVYIKDLSSPGTATEMLDGNSCEILQLNIIVTGNIQNMADFVRGLSKTFPTSVIKSMQMKISTPSPTPTGVPIQAEEVSAASPESSPAPDQEETEETPREDTEININLVIYNFKGK
jgi:Tfp pilus assembly protein PilO